MKLGLYYTIVCLFFSAFVLLHLRLCMNCSIFFFSACTHIFLYVVQVSHPVPCSSEYHHISIMRLGMSSITKSSYLNFPLMAFFLDSVIKKLFLFSFLTANNFCFACLPSFTFFIISIGLSTIKSRQVGHSLLPTLRCHSAIMTLAFLQHLH